MCFNNLGSSSNLCLWGQKCAAIADFSTSKFFTCRMCLCACVCAWVLVWVRRAHRGDKMNPFCYVTNIWQVLCFLARGHWRIWRRMVLQKLLKMSSVYINAQLVSACKWLCLTNNCCSFCHMGNQLFWSGYRCLVHQTLHLPQIKKSIGVRSGEHGGHCAGPPLPLQRLG